VDPFCFTFQRLGTVKLVFWLKFCISFFLPFNVISGYLISTNHLKGKGEEVFDVKQHIGKASQVRKQSNSGLWRCDNWNLFCSPQQSLKPKPLKDRGSSSGLWVKRTRPPGRTPYYLWGLGHVPEQFHFQPRGCTLGRAMPTICYWP
jgi:hypothetical protein